MICIIINYLFNLFLYVYLFGLSISQPVSQLLSESICEKYLYFCLFTYVFTFCFIHWYTFYLILKYSIPCIFIYVTSLQLHQLSTHFLFITHLYHISPACSSVSHTIFRENLCVPYSKPPACTQANICGASWWLVDRAS